MIVVDTNILAYLYLPGEHTWAAEQLLITDSDWIVPMLWRSEFRNILAGFIRRGMLTFSQACDIQAEAESSLNGSEFEVDSSNVLSLIDISDCSAYDCEFVSLAKRLSVKLATMDKKLLRNFPDVATALPTLKSRRKI